MYQEALGGLPPSGMMTFYKRTLCSTVHDFWKSSLEMNVYCGKKIKIRLFTTRDNKIISDANDSSNVFCPRLNS